MRSVVLIAIVSVAMAATMDCTWSPQKGITYDLSPLRNDKQDYTIYDYLGATGNATFYFNICRDVVSIPSHGAEGNACKRTVHDIVDGHEVTEDRPVPVFWYDHESGECARYAGSLEDTEKKPYVWQTYDYNDKAAGVNLYYQGGDYYWEGYFYKSTILSFRCSDSATIPKRADVERWSISTYIIWLDSVYACPKECHPNSKGQICSGHGICMTDESIEASRCFCNTGFKGEDCSKDVGLSMTDYVLIVDIAMVVVILLTIVFLGCKLRKIRLDPDAAVSLDTKFNELGSIAYTL